MTEQKQRALLSATGIMVGCAAITLLISVGRGVEEDISRQVTSLGVNLLVVIPGRLSEGSMFSPNLAGLSYITDADVERVRKVPGVLRAAPLMFVGGGIRNGKQESPSTFIVAAGTDWFQIHPSKLAQGRYYAANDVHNHVCVIGSIARENLFGKKEALGKTVAINGAKYTVIGITEDPKAEDSLFSMGGFENMAYIPYDLVRDTVPNPQINRIMIQTAPDREPKTLVAAVNASLSQRLSQEQFSVMTQEDLLGVIYKVLGLLTSLLSGLTSIALVVGGMGIMTVMLMSVNERTKEIGIRKTVGARRSDIFQQFLFEAITLSLLGGACGLLLSYAACVALTDLTKIHPLLSFDVILLGVSVTLGVGTVFGLLPAMKAAKKNPVDALRTE
jgi:putative ABC transport system permease protein